MHIYTFKIKFSLRFLTHCGAIFILPCAPCSLHANNSDAAASVGVSNLLQNSNFDGQYSAGVDGNGFYINLFEIGIPREHQEFSENGVSRIHPKDTADPNAEPDAHAEHIAGTLIARGSDPSLKGMAPAAGILAFIGQSTTKIEGSAMAWPFESGKAIVGNTSLVDERSEVVLGAYSSVDAELDVALRSKPYYLHFTAAGNVDAADFGSIQGESKEAKNAMVIGAGEHVQRDAEGTLLSGGARLLNSAKGPSDDGRVKPDLIAPGKEIVSTLGIDLTAVRSGTSVASAVAAGAANALQHYTSLRFPGHLLRASTLKALLLHSADDLGNPGPDYAYGWGYLNADAAAKVIRSQATAPQRQIVTESLLRHPSDSQVFEFYLSAGAAAKFTLVWWDLDGLPSSSDADRNSDLAHDLNMRLVAPDASVSLPWAMPYVLNGFNAADLDAPAVRGVNASDAVEQISLDPVPASGTYQLIIEASGLFDDQVFSLIATGMDAPLAAPPAPTIDSAAVTTLTTDPTVPLTLSGAHFTFGSTAVLDLADGRRLRAFSNSALPNALVARFNINGLPPGSATLRVLNPDGQAATLPTPITLDNAATFNFQNWIQTFPELTTTTDRDPATDFDRDSLPNLLEFAFGLSPSQHDAPRPFALSTHADPSGTFLQIQYRRLPNGTQPNPDGLYGYEAAGLRYTLQASSDLQNWDATATLFQHVGSPIDNGDGTESVTVRFVTPLSSAAPLTLRIRVDPIP